MYNYRDCGGGEGLALADVISTQNLFRTEIVHLAVFATSEHIIYHLVFLAPPDGSLASMLVDEEGGLEPLPLDQSLFYLQQILQGLYHLHSCSIVHLDIKGVWMWLLISLLERCHHFRGY